eukprot:TRINITY_DN1899_c1_g1_i1.p1 TRINITY_DN1899_c1_g1~~TRINITY_DN1899_c1_g1_i1.p1  ORF type:complete len:642 (-),score=69.84 TRINITY_DN1899_c1_g1_i1:3023-4948(-)
MAGGADLDETPRWRLSILFMIIVVFSLVGHIGIHMLEEYFRRHKRIGLKHTLSSLKDELFALGLITLLLLVFQDQIVKMCIDGNSSKDDYYGSKDRKLLAGGDYYECPKGQESFWSITALHEIHILIFLIAIVHLVQASLSMVLASLRVKKWKKYEDRVQHDMIPLKKKRAIKTKGSWAGLWIYSFFTQFSDSVDGPVYLAIRRFFLEKMELDDDFNFFNYVVDSMEEDFARLVEFQWVMWIIAAIWILIPWQGYVIIWLPCVFFIVMLIVGAKLQSVAISLATLAYTHYTPKFIPHKSRHQKSLFRKSASKLKSLINKSNSNTNLTKLAKQQKAEETDGRPVSEGKEHSSVEITQMNDIATNSHTPRQSNQDSALDIESQNMDAKQDKSKSSQIANYMGNTSLLSDSSSLFWFGKPKLLLIIFQYMYFVSGLVVALLILDEWRGQRINHLTDSYIYILMIGVNLLMLIHAAIFIIPSYAITVAAGAYGPDNILRKALKKNVNPELAKKLNLERMSYNSNLDSDMESVQGQTRDDSDSVQEQESNHGGHSSGHGHGYDDARIRTLLEAMDNSQVRKKKMEAQEQPVFTGASPKFLETIMSQHSAELAAIQSSRNMLHASKSNEENSTTFAEIKEVEENNNY